jgi:hypothetical protein
MATTKINRPTVIEHNIETNEIVEREMNDYEYEKHLADKAITEANRVAFEAQSLLG